jgi:CBS domain-containing protein
MPMLARLAWVNLALGTFNLLPAFPMDGGRVLRAILAMRMDHGRATRIAAGLGRALATVLGFIGLFASPVLLFVAVFVWLGATAENGAEELKIATRGLRVSDAMVRDFEVLLPGDSLATAADHVLAGFQTHFPVVEHGRVVGVLSNGELIAGLAERGGDAAVESVMRRDVELIDANETLEQGLERLHPPTRAAFAALPVFAAGELVGMLTLEGVGELVAIRTALTKVPRSRGVIATNVGHARHA